MWRKYQKTLEVASMNADGFSSILMVIGTIYRLLAYFGLILWPVGFSRR